MENNESKKELTTCFSSIIKDSGSDWAIKISEQVEDKNDIRKPNNFISNTPMSTFEEVTFNIQKIKSKKITKIIPHDSNYYLQSLSNPDPKSTNENDFSDDVLLHLPEQDTNK